MHQGIQIVADRLEQAQVALTRPSSADALPSLVAGSCQTALKRVLRRTAVLTASRARHGEHEVEARAADARDPERHSDLPQKIEVPQRQ
jgi:hypothetical protein